MSKKPMRPARDLLGQAVGREKVIKAMRAWRVARRWAECVGPQLDERCRPDRYEDGSLWVAVTGASWSQELRMRKREIIARLNEMAGEPLFTELRFGVRPLPERSSGLRDDDPPAGFVPEPVEIECGIPELKEAALSALGKLKAASRRGEDEDGVERTSR